MNAGIGTGPIICWHMTARFAFVALLSLILPAAAATQTQTAAVIVDDYVRQPNQGDSDWFYNRLGGNRGTLAESAESATVTWGQGSVTASIQTGSYAGVWNSLRHNTSERATEDALHLDAILPPQILSAYQPRVTALRFRVIDGRGTFKAELKNATTLAVWDRTAPLTGGVQTIEFAIAPGLAHRHELNWLVTGGAGDFVTVDGVEFVIAAPALTTAQSAFLYSFGMLLDNLAVRGPDAGLTRDRANFPSGDFDNTSANGGLAAAAVLAWQVGIISRQSAADLVELIAGRLLQLPVCHGLWPHFTTNGNIAPDTEWSSVDSIFALMSLLVAGQALELSTTAVEAALSAIDWNDLTLADGAMSHGYGYTAGAPHCGPRISSGWTDFGTESWLANLGLAAGADRIGPMDSTPPTFNGSGFIDELAWLLVPAPVRDRHGTEWQNYRTAAADAQLAYYPANYPSHCYVAAGLFGLSAAEVPVPSAVARSAIYQPFGIGGSGAPADDGAALLGQPVVAPHHSAMISILRPSQSAATWSWLLTRNLVSPLTGVESLMATDPATCDVAWNDLKGSWNLVLQALGWGSALTGSANELHRAAFEHPLLRRAYAAMVGTPFTDDPLTAGVSIRRAHVTELRSRIDALRTRFQLPAVSWTDITAGVTLVAAQHVDQLRAALGAAYSAAGRAVPVYTDPVLSAGTTIVQAVHFRELRTNVKMLEIEFP